MAVEVDGEQFADRVLVDPATGYIDTGYTWPSGPHDGSGVLAMVEPETVRTTGRVAKLDVR